MNKLTKEEKTEIIKIVLDSAQIIFETETGSQADLDIEVKGLIIIVAVAFDMRKNKPAT